MTGSVDAVSFRVPAPSLRHWDVPQTLRLISVPGQVITPELSDWFRFFFSRDSVTVTAAMSETLGHGLQPWLEITRQYTAFEKTGQSTHAERRLTAIRRVSIKSALQIKKMMKESPLDGVASIILYSIAIEVA